MTPPPFGKVGERRATRAAFIKERVAKLKAEGMERRDIATRLGISLDTVRAVTTQLAREGR